MNKICGLTVNWNYEASYVDMAIPGYAPNASNRLQHTPKISPQYSPYHHTGFKYCAPGTQKYAMEPDEELILSKQDTTFVQYIVDHSCYMLDRLTAPLFQP